MRIDDKTKVQSDKSHFGISTFPMISFHRLRHTVIVIQCVTRITMEYLPMYETNGK